MKVTITKASNWDFKKVEEINTLEDLHSIIKKYGNKGDNTFYRVIYSLDSKHIDIYDDYVE